MNNYERHHRRAESIKQMYPPGTRIELICMNDPYSPVPSGTRGTVRMHSESSLRKKLKQKSYRNLEMKISMKIIQ